jgi:acyl-CoA thioesterase-1
MSWLALRASRIVGARAFGPGPARPLRGLALRASRIVEARASGPGPARPLRGLALALGALLAVSGCGGGNGGAAGGPAALERPRLVFFGDSLTAGHGVLREEAFPALVQKELDAAGLAYEVVNAGVSGDTTADGLSRLDWALSRGAALVVLELGANDGLRGLDLGAARKALAELMRRIQAKSIPLLLVGMRISPNYGPAYAARFSEMFPSLAAEFRVPLVPFLMEGVGGVASLTQADGTHPNAAGHRVMARTVWAALQPLLRPARPAQGKP